jgi:hypothetical protein
MGQWKHIGRNNGFLYPVRELSKTFKGKFIDSMKRKLKNEGMLERFDTHIQKAYKTNWVVCSEASLAKADHVIRYLGQYTHRVAITNQRIVNINKTHVTFIAKDYRDRAQKKPVTLTGTEFLKRFCMHIMPKRLVRIRRFGIYNPTTIRNLKLQFVPEQKPDIEQLKKPKEKETSIERIKPLTGFDILKCPTCKKGKMYRVRKIPRIRSPPNHLPTLLLSKLLEFKYKTKKSSCT